MGAVLLPGCVRRPGAFLPGFLLLPGAGLLLGAFGGGLLVGGLLMDRLVASGLLLGVFRLRMLGLGGPLLGWTGLGALVRLGLGLRLGGAGRVLCGLSPGRFALWLRPGRFALRLRLAFGGMVGGGGSGRRRPGLFFFRFGTFVLGVGQRAEEYEGAGGE